MDVKTYLIIQIVCRIAIAVWLLFFVVAKWKIICCHFLKPTKKNASYWFELILTILAVVSYIYFIIDYFMFEFVLQKNFLLQ